MNKISVNLLTNVVLLLAGLLLIIFFRSPDVLTWVVRVIGALFLLPAAAFLLMVSFQHADARTSTNFVGILPAVGGLCFGLLMLVNPAWFENVLCVLMGVLLLALGLFHIVYLLLSWRAIGVKAWYLVCPLAVVVCGVLILMVDVVRGDTSLVVLLSGISLLLFNFTSLQEYMAERRSRTSRLDVEQLPASVDEVVPETPSEKEE